MTRIGDIRYFEGYPRPVTITEWDGSQKHTITHVSRHRDGKGFTLTWNEYGYTVVGVHRGDNTFVRVRGVTVAPAPRCAAALARNTGPVSP